jgi:hypothetical protein
MISSPKFAQAACRAYAQLRLTKPELFVKSEVESVQQERNGKIRETFLAEVGGLFGLNAEAVSQKLSALKGQYALPKIPQGKRGRTVKAEDKAASEAESIKAMAEAGLEPVRDENGAIVDWAEIVTA